jgi:hypothetical protein
MEAFSSGKLYGIGTCAPPRRRIEVIEAALLHARGNLGSNAVRRPALLDDQAAGGAAHRIDDGLPVDGANRAKVDHLDVDVLFLQLPCRLVGDHGHA